MKPLVVTISCLLVPLAVQAKDKTPKPAPLRIYIHLETDPSGFVDEDSQKRSAFARCLQTLLSEATAKGCTWVRQTSAFLRAVPNAEASQLQLEITDRAPVKVYDESGFSLNQLASAFNGRTADPKENYARTVVMQNATLRVGSFETTFAAERPDGLIKLLEQWVKLNQDKFISARALTDHERGQAEHLEQPEDRREHDDHADHQLDRRRERQRLGEVQQQPEHDQHHDE
jgi:hypothetical protein